MLKKMKTLFKTLVKTVKAKTGYSDISLSNKELNQELMTKIDTRRLEIIEKRLETLGLLVANHSVEEGKTQEYLNHNSTLLELIINQLDQGNIAFVKMAGNPNPLEAMDYEGEDIIETPKKKSELN